MQWSMFEGWLRALPLVSLAVLGCGPDFDPPSELHSLRVLGIQKDMPYADPGQTVHLHMLWEDASEHAARSVVVRWSGPCFDPAADLYYACFTDPNLFTGMTGGDRASFAMPKDIISRRPPPSDAKNARYGIAYVFFAVCAGELVPVPVTEETAFPIGCRDESGKLLGSDDFVAGYVSVYSFQSFHNDNPFVSGFEFQGRPVASASFCTDHGSADADDPTGTDDCQARAGSSAPRDIDCDDPKQAQLCVPSCAADGDSSCPAYAIRPTVDKSNVSNQNQDDVSKQLLGRNVGEQMWIDYYTDAGKFKSAVRLLSDATSGWNDDYGTKYYAPKAPGLARVWALVHDNRGGVGWAGVTLKVQ